LKIFVSENDCKDVDLTILLPQNILEDINVSRLKNVSDYVHKLGFKLGVYLLGAKYIHNYCHIHDVFDRYVVKSEYIAHAICSNGNIEYCADTLAILKKFVDVLTVPNLIPDYEKELMFKAGFADFSVSEQSVEGLQALVNDYKQRGVKRVENSKIIHNSVAPLDASVAMHDIIHGRMVLMSYDIARQRLSVTPNASKVLGYDVYSSLDKERSPSIMSAVHPDDAQLVSEKISQARMNLGLVIFEARVGTGPNKDIFKKFCITAICSVDDMGTPVRLQITLMEVSE
jgi:hypothetical protein